MSVFETACDRALMIPEVQEEVFRHGGLSRTDLVKASRICRAWFVIVSAYIWENIDVDEIKIPHQKAFKTGLATHGRWIKTFKTTNDEIVNWLSTSRFCTRLLAIDFRPRQVSLSRRHPVSVLVLKNPNIQTLRYYSPVIDLSFSVLASGLIGLVPEFLTALDFRSMKLDKGFCQVLNHHVFKMSYLRLEQCRVLSDAFEAGLKQLLNLKTLVWEETEINHPRYLFTQPRTIWSKEFSTLLAAGCNLSEVVIKVYDQLFIQDVIDWLIRGRPEKLESLNLTWYIWTESDLYGVMGVLWKALPHQLKRLTLFGFNFNDISNISLCDVSKNNQLTTVNMMGCKDIQTATWLTILTSCPSLIEICGAWNSPMYVRVIKEPWMCMNLKVMEMTFIMGTESDVGITSQKFDELDTILFHQCEELFSRLILLTRLISLKFEICVHGSNWEWQSHQHEGWRDTVSYRRDVEQPKFKADRERFRLLWEGLKVCSRLNTVQFETDIPDRILGEVELKACSQEMWPDAMVSIGRLRGWRGH